MAFRLAYLMLIRVLDWLTLLARSDTAKDVAGNRVRGQRTALRGERVTGSLHMSPASSSRTLRTSAALVCWRAPSEQARAAAIGPVRTTAKPHVDPAALRWGHGDGLVPRGLSELLVALAR